MNFEVKFLKEAASGKTVFIKTRNKFKTDAVYIIEKPKGKCFFCKEIISRFLDKKSFIKFFFTVPYSKIFCVVNIMKVPTSIIRNNILDFSSVDSKFLQLYAYLWRSIFCFWKSGLGFSFLFLCVFFIYCTADNSVENL